MIDRWALLIRQFKTITSKLSSSLGQLRRVDYRMDIVLLRATAQLYEAHLGLALISASPLTL